MVSLLAPYAASSASTWVVSLGTNDNPEEFADQAAAVMDLAGPDRCVVWFDVWRVDTDEAINATLQSTGRGVPEPALVAWHDVASVHPEWFSGTDVHPSTAGYAVRGQTGGRRGQPRVRRQPLARHQLVHPAVAVIGPSVLQVQQMLRAGVR